MSWLAGGSVQEPFILLCDRFTTVSRVERRLRKQPKKYLGMVKRDLDSNCAEFYFSMGRRKQLLASEASSGHNLRNCALWGFFHPKKSFLENSGKFQVKGKFLLGVRNSEYWPIFTCGWARRSQFSFKRSFNCLMHGYIIFRDMKNLFIQRMMENM